MTSSSNLQYFTRLDKDRKPSAPEGKLKVFISYRQDDNKYNLLKKCVSLLLEAYDCAIWYDNSLTPGFYYDKEIEKAIQDSDIFIILLTETIVKSHFIWENELPPAKVQHKFILPIRISLSEKDLEGVNDKLGHIEMINGELLSGSYLASCKEAFNEDRNVFISKLQRGISAFVASRNIASQAMSFYNAGKDTLPIKVLTYEQLYLLAYGMLRGISPEIDCDKAINIMSSMLKVFSYDSETLEFKSLIAEELMNYYAGISSYELAYKYGNQALSYGNNAVNKTLSELSILHPEVIPSGSISFTDNLLSNPSIEALREIILSTLSASGSYLPDGVYSKLLPILFKAHEIGDISDTYRLISSVISKSDIDSFKKLLNDEKINISGLSGLLPYIDNTSVQKGVTLSFITDVDYPELLGQPVEFEGSKFNLYPFIFSDNSVAVYLLRNSSEVIFALYNLCKGVDFETYDLVVEDGKLIIKEYDFDHRDVETYINNIYIQNPFEEIVIYYTLPCKSQKGVIRKGIAPVQLL